MQMNSKCNEFKKIRMTVPVVKTNWLYKLLQSKIFTSIPQLPSIDSENLEYLLLWMLLLINQLMDLIPYSFAPLILFSVPYTLELLPYIYRLQMALGV